MEALVAEETAGQISGPGPDLDPAERRLLAAMPRLDSGDVQTRTTDKGTLLDVRDLEVIFPIAQGPFRKAKPLRAVDGVSFVLRKHETLGVGARSRCDGREFAGGGPGCGHLHV